MTTTRFDFHSDPGPRGHQEDEARALILRQTAPSACEVPVLVIADGAGGHNAGEVASAICTRLVPSFVAASLLARPPARDHGAFVDGLAETLVQANLAVVQAANASRATSGMASTVVCAVLVEDRCIVAWAGDSRAYLYRPTTRQLLRLTHDHSEIQRLVDRELLAPAAASTHPLAHTIYRYVGQPEGFVPEIRIAPLAPGDLVLCCTDGVTDVLGDEAIARIVESWLPDTDDSQGLSRAVVQAALDAGTTDNTTVLCCLHDPPASPRKAFAETRTGAYPEALISVFESLKENDHATPHPPKPAAG